MAEEDRGRGRTRKRREMEVKDKIEETKEENGIKGTTLKTKTTETDHEMEHNCPGRQLPKKRKYFVHHFVISLY